MSPQLEPTFPRTHTHTPFTRTHTHLHQNTYTHNLHHHTHTRTLEEARNVCLSESQVKIRHFLIACSLHKLFHVETFSGPEDNSSLTFTTGRNHLYWPALPKSNSTIRTSPRPLDRVKEESMEIEETSYNQKEGSQQGHPLSPASLAHPWTFNSERSTRKHTTPTKQTTEKPWLWLHRRIQAGWSRLFPIMSRTSLDRIWTTPQVDLLRNWSRDGRNEL